MESISTPRRSGLPWAANLATLAVVVVTTWWSGAQWPVATPADPTGHAVQTVAPGALPSPQPATNSEPASAEPQPLRVNADGANATVAQATLGGATLQTVSFKPVTH